jgi:hypothetical protein
LRQIIYQYVPADKLQAAVEECERLVRPLDDSHFDFLAHRYGHLREFAPAFLQAFTFRSNLNPDPLLQAVELLRTLNQERRRASEVHSGHVAPLRRRPLRADRSALLRAVRAVGIGGSAACRGVWLETSRRYANPESYLIPPASWPASRPEV